MVYHKRVDSPMTLLQMLPSTARGALAYRAQEDCVVNLAGVYRYLEAGYYTSQDLEAAGIHVRPTCQEILDGTIVPLFLEKARSAALAIPDYSITNDYFEPPAIVDTLNPFMSRQCVVRKPGHQERVAKSMTRNYTYAICCQELPPGCRIGAFRAVLGWCWPRRYRALAAAVWEVFHLPLAVVRVMVCDDGRVLLSGLQPLPLTRLYARERAYLDKVVQWLT